MKTGGVVGVDDGIVQSNFVFNICRVSDLRGQIACVFHFPSLYRFQHNVLDMTNDCYSMVLVNIFFIRIILLILWFCIVPLV